MPAGPISDLMIHCSDPGITKVVDQMEKKGWTKEEIHTGLEKTIVTDPLKFAPYVPKDRVMVFLALFDRIVRASRTFGLWKAMDRPKLKLIPLGHYGGMLIFPYLEIVSLWYYRLRL